MEKIKFKTQVDYENYIKTKLRKFNKWFLEHQYPEQQKETEKLINIFSDYRKRKTNGT